MSFYRKNKTASNLQTKLYRKRRRRENLTALAFLAPNVTGFLIFGFTPIIASLVLAFTSWDILTPLKWVGLSNFLNLLGFHQEAGRIVANDPFFWKYLANTTFFLLSIPLGIIVSLSLALLINQKLRGIVIFRTIYFLPVISSLIACAILWRWIYNPDFGILNSFLAKVGIKGPDWLASTAWAKPAILLMGVWQGAGYTMLLYLAALQGISEELYEAASIDGAGRWYKFTHITWPLLGPTHFFVIIMGVIGSFQAFGAMYVMTGGGPAGATTTIVYYIYNNAFQWFKMGYAAAISWILAAIIFAFTIFQWKYMKGRMYGA